MKKKNRLTHWKRFAIPKKYQIIQGAQHNTTGDERPDTAKGRKRWECNRSRRTAGKNFLEKPFHAQFLKDRVIEFEVEQRRPLSQPISNEEVLEAVKKLKSAKNLSWKIFTQNSWKMVYRPWVQKLPKSYLSLSMALKYRIWISIFGSCSKTEEGESRCVRFLSLNFATCTEKSTSANHIKQT